MDQSKMNTLVEKREERPSTPHSDASDSSFHSMTDNLDNVDINDKSKEASLASTNSQEEEIEFHQSRDDPEDEASDKEESEDCEVDLYFVDEELLKDQELSLSDDDKAKRQMEALEYKENGNNLFKQANFADAAIAYTSGLRICPLSCSKDRAILYANRAASRSKFEEKKPAIQDCAKAIELDEHYVKAILRRAKLYEETESLDEALLDFKKVLELDPSHHEARTATIRLPPLIEARNEKLKEEMMGKLKDLGNVFLRPFGLSTDNFKLNQDPNTGGYNVQFNQNASKS